jgi:hypothetical protein
VLIGSTATSFDGPITQTNGALKVNAGASLTVTSTYTLSVGTLEVDGALSVCTLTQTSGTVTGAGALTVTCSLAWSGGSWSGSGSSLISGPVSVTGSVSISQRAVSTTAAVSWSAGSIALASSTWTVGPASTLTVTSSGNMTGTGGILEVQGTVSKTTGTSTFVFPRLNIASSGRVNSQSTTGALVLLGGGAFAGTFDNAATSSATFGAGTFTVSAAAQVSRSGAYLIQSLLDGGAEVTLDLAGGLGNAGTTTLVSGGTLILRRSPPR